VKNLLLLLLCMGALTANSQAIACRCMKNVSGSFEIIKDSAHKIANSPDDCVVELIDSLVRGFIKTHKTAYMECLDSICFYEAEADQLLPGDTLLFYHSFKPYIDYLYENSDTGTCLEFNLEAGFGFDMMEDADDKFEAKNRLENFIKEQEKLYVFPEEEKTFIDLIRKRAEELKVDEER